MCDYDNGKKVQMLMGAITFNTYIIKNAIPHDNECIFSKLYLFQFKHSLSKIYNGNYSNNMDIRNIYLNNTQNGFKHLQ
jgi:hypothetical protein